jgi:hypothetical protein
MDNSEFQNYTKRVDELVQRVSALPDAEARTAALDLLQSVMDLHGAAMSRVIELLSSDSVPLTKLTQDPLVCGLLVLYGIHPASTEERVTRAVETLCLQLRKYDADLELVGIQDGSVRIKIRGKVSAPEKVKTAIQQGILEVAPEVTAIIIDGLTSATFVPVTMIQPAMREENTYEESTAGH